MINCQDKPTLLPESLWKALMNLPALRYMKAPVNNEAELYEKYPDGNEKGTFAFVHNDNTFYTYHPRGCNRGKWKPISADGVSSFFEIDAEFLKEGDILVYDSKKKKFVVKSGNVWNRLFVDLKDSFVQVTKFLNQVDEVPTDASDSGVYFVHKDENNVEFRALYIVLGKKAIKIYQSSDYYTATEVQDKLDKKANQTQVDDIAASVDVLAVTKAEKSVVDALLNGIIKQPAVDTYNDTSGGKISLLNKYPNPKVGWDVLVRKDETKGGKSNRYNWNGSQWVDMETGVYGENVVNKDTIYNISQETNNYAYADKQTARNAVPTDKRALTQIIVYKLADGSIINEQYTGRWTDDSAWLFDGNWQDITLRKKFLLTTGNLNIDYTTKKISIPEGYIYTDKGRIETQATELDMFDDSFSNVFYDLSNNKFVNIKTLELANQTSDYVLVCIVSDVKGGNVFTQVNNVTIEGIPYNFYKNRSNVTVAFSDENYVTTTYNTITIPKSAVIVTNAGRYNLTASTTLNVTSDFGYIVFNTQSKIFRIEIGDYSNKVYNDDFVIGAFVKIGDKIKIFGIESDYKDEAKLKYINKYKSFVIASIAKPIVINTISRKINFTKNINIVYRGSNYSLKMDNDFILDYATTGYNVKYIYFDVSKISEAVSRGLQQSHFTVITQGGIEVNNLNLVLIAVLPDSSYQNNIKPYTVFDFVTEHEESRTAINAEGFDNHIPTVKSLKSSDADYLLDASALGEFNRYIGLWDDLVTRANRTRVYIKKCWIDGTAYDNSSKCMSTLPTSGSHNITGDMAQYPLLMYQLRPDTFDGISYSDTCKPTRRKILIVSGVHGGSSGGDHWESPISWYYVAKKLVEEFYMSPSFNFIRNNYSIDFIPAANPWGLNNLQRHCGTGIDINRDFVDGTGFTTNEAKYIRDVLKSGYDLAHDSHCLGGLSLTSGDLAGSNFIGIATDLRVLQIFRQILYHIESKYDVKTGSMPLVANTLAYYSNSLGILTSSSELPANTPLYFGDTVGDPHGLEVVRRATYFSQNILAVMANFIAKENRL